MVQNSTLPNMITIINKLNDKGYFMEFIEGGIEVEGDVIVRVDVNTNLPANIDDEELLEKTCVIRISNGEKYFEVFDNDKAVEIIESIVKPISLDSLFEEEKPKEEKYSTFFKNGVQMIGIKTKYMLTLETVQETIDYLKTVFVFTDNDIALMSKLTIDELRTFVREYRNRFKNRAVEKN